jgi:uncharacterized coiled-coil protein SlyX
MSRKSASESKIRELNRQLAETKTELARTRNELQQEITRWQRLVPSHYISLMGVYPPLRKLLHVLAEAADAQDPTRGAPVEDTMRTEVTELTPTERGVISHWKARSNVRFMRDELEILRKRFNEALEAKTAHFANVAGTTAWEYNPPRPVCHRKGCRMRGRQQSYSAWENGCEGCGRRFEMEAANG